MIETPLYFLLLFFSYTIYLHHVPGVQRLDLPHDFIYLFNGVFETLCFSAIIFYPLKKRPYTRVFFASVFGMFYSILASYHLRTKSTVDFGMIISNSSTLDNSKSWKIIFNTFPLIDWIEIVFWSFIPWKILKWNQKYKSKINVNNRYNIVPILIGFLIVLACVGNGNRTINKQTEFMQSAWLYLYPKKLPFSPTTEEKEMYYKNALANKPERLKSAPGGLPDNIVLIFLESFNAGYVEKKSPNGKEYTPYFNELIKKGVFFENFFANSMQTSKGQFAALCSQVPHSSLKEMVQLSQLKIACLPQLMKEQGYHTVFMQGLDDPTFDNTTNFYKAHGFDEIFSMDNSFISKDEKKYIWGWGVQDNILFQKALDYRKNLKDKKVFLTLATISNHMKFDEIPDHYKTIYPGTTDNDPMDKRFANSVHTMDLFLKEFFFKLDSLGLTKNTMVILVGDHGFPMGEHGNFQSENSFYNENFKTPLLIIAPFLKPQRISLYRSQIDIAPTLLNMLGAPPGLHFMGEHLFDSKDHIVPLIQPYDGKYISIIKNRKKYVYHVSRNEKDLFNLDVDPTEKQSVYNASEDSVYYPELKNILLNDYFLEKMNQQPGN
jgi:phosphoglycerol transferase MdoB-like AlkP superfamily enzyme